MRIEVMDYRKTKLEAQRYISNKLPLASRVTQFNSFIDNLHVEYVEFKIINYEISVKKKNSLKRNDVKREKINIIVNTSDGRSESIKSLPKTSHKYVPKTCIRKNSIDEKQLTVKVKEEIVNYLIRNKNHFEYLDKSLYEVNLIDIKSIYKACWIAEFRGRNIIIDI